MADTKCGQSVFPLCIMLIISYIIQQPIWFLTGTSDGQTKVVREGDNGVAYAWNMAEQKWDKVILLPVNPKGKNLTYMVSVSLNLCKSVPLVNLKFCSVIYK